jgi:thiol-disulfide isomerase/thioredoxin
MHQFAKERGGKCLSEKYIHNHAPLEWQCKIGHTWKASIHYIKSDGVWCTKCNKIDKKENMLNSLQEIAELNGGKCLSNEYIDKNVAMEWQCKKGHRWSAKPEKILYGRWCPDCIKVPRKIIWMKTMHEMAEQHGGKCLSKEYFHEEKPLKWKCKNGHIWEAAPRLIRHFGIWCTKCNKINKTAKALKRLQKIAKEHGGKCLSKKYINSHTHLKWQCKNGHTWKTAPRNIIEGNWCRKCHNNRGKEFNQIYK